MSLPEKTRTTAILGTVGIPARYGGFETLAENLVRYHYEQALPGKLVVYCSSVGSRNRPASHLGADLRYVPLEPNGPVSVLYDVVSLMAAVIRRADVILLLGVSGAAALPLVRLFSKARIVTNVDGVEWKREKWTGFARWWLKQSERWAVRFSHVVVADNAGIAEHLAKMYGRTANVIAYGGDHAVEVAPGGRGSLNLPEQYALALCRIEPENNVTMILAGFADTPGMPLVFVGNWDKSSYGQELRKKYAGNPNITLLDPIYDPALLRTVREGAALYVHGHSAGGTNPSLVEMMHFGCAVLAFDCVFNRATTENRAVFFRNDDDLCARVAELTPQDARSVGAAMVNIARKRYTWDAIGRDYFRVIG
jgi:glycosyltransferase involved in cell wall biosynthesis